MHKEIEFSANILSLKQCIPTQPQRKPTFMRPYSPFQALKYDMRKKTRKYLTNLTLVFKSVFSAIFQAWVFRGLARHKVVPATNFWSSSWFFFLSSWIFLLLSFTWLECLWVRRHRFVPPKSCKISSWFFKRLFDLLLSSYQAWMFGGFGRHKVVPTN